MGRMGAHALAPLVTVMQGAPANQPTHERAFCTQYAQQWTLACTQDEERLWGEIIDKYEDVDAPWRGDIVGRAYGNRGNARTRQGKMDAALVDYNRAIDICPWSVDPVLNRRASCIRNALNHAVLQFVSIQCRDLANESARSAAGPCAEQRCLLCCCRGVLFENTGRFQEALTDYK